jgi:hypothetical protein
MLFQHRHSVGLGFAVTLGDGQTSAKCAEVTTAGIAIEWRTSLSEVEFPTTRILSILPLSFADVPAFRDDSTNTEVAEF